MIEQKVVFGRVTSTTCGSTVAILVSTSAPRGPFDWAPRPLLRHAVAAFASLRCFCCRHRRGTKALGESGRKRAGVVLAARHLFGVAGPITARMKMSRSLQRSYVLQPKQTAGQAQVQDAHRLVPDIARQNRCRYKEGLVLKKDDSVSAALKDDVHGIAVKVLHRNVSAITDTGTVVCLRNIVIKTESGAHARSMRTIRSTTRFFLQRWFFWLAFLF